MLVDIEKIKLELHRAMRYSEMNEKEVAIPNANHAIVHSAKSLKAEAAEKIDALIRLVISEKSDNDVLIFDALALPITKDKKGIHLFDDDYNGKKESIYLLSDGKLAKTIKPLLIDSTLENIDSLFVTTNYGAYECCEEIQRAITHLKNRYKKSYTSNMKTYGQTPRDLEDEAKRSAAPA